MGRIVNEFLIPLIIWEVMETKDDFAMLFKLMTVIILISCIYGFIEYRIQANPLMLYEMTLNNDADKIINFSYGAGGIRGYHVQSIFEHAIGAGMTWALYIGVVFMLIVNVKKIQTLSIITAVMCVPVIMFTKQRSGIFFLIILSPIFLNPKKMDVLSINPCSVGSASFSRSVV